MGKYYEKFKALIIATSLSGYYMSSIELIYGKKWYLKQSKYFFYFLAISLPLYFFFSIKYVLYDEGEIGPKLYGVALVVYCFFSAFLTYSFHFNIEKFVKLFELWDSMFQEELFSEDRQMLLDENIKTTNRWLKVFGGSSLLTSIFYCSATYFNEDKKLDHPIGIPYRNQSPDFELLNTYDLICSTLGFATLITYDSMTMAFFCLEEAQLRHLKNSLAKITDIFTVTECGKILINSENENFTELGEREIDKERMKRGFEEMEEKLKIWILHHHQVLRFCVISSFVLKISAAGILAPQVLIASPEILFHDELQSLYHVPLSLKFFAFVIICCISGFLLATGTLPMKDNVLAIAFCFNNYSIFYVNITFADSIRATAESIFGDVFGKSWYLYPDKIKTAFKIILMRSQRPVRYLAIWIYPIDSRTFLKILTSVYSLSTFLLQVNRKYN